MGNTMICANRVAIITGAGSGLGRAHAAEFAAQGARVVVNDLDEGDAARTAAAVRSRGGAAVATGGDVAAPGVAVELVRAALENFGRLDVVVNNAGFVRDRMLVNLSDEEWESVVRVHLTGHFLVLRQAARHWRAEARAGRAVRGRVVNTTSGAGLLGSVGQGNYASAKAGVVGLTLVAASELARYGVTVNAIAPAARTPMTEGVLADAMRPPVSGFDAMDPANVSPLVAWLGSVDSGDVTGRVFEVEGGRIAVMAGFRRGPATDRGARWDAGEIGPAVRGMLARAEPPVPAYGARAT